MIDSEITHIDAHKIAILYATPLLTYYDAFGNCLLLSAADTVTLDSSLMTETFILKMQTRFFIVNYQAL